MSYLPIVPPGEWGGRPVRTAIRACEEAAREWKTASFAERLAMLTSAEVALVYSGSVSAAVYFADGPVAGGQAVFSVSSILAAIYVTSPSKASMRTPSEPFERPYDTYEYAIVHYALDDDLTIIAILALRRR